MGEAGLCARTRRKFPNRASARETKVRILEIFHSQPSTYGINRASWTGESLAKALHKKYRVTISAMTASRHLRESGHTMRRARQVLTSFDPNYREKVEVLLQTLQTLGDTEQVTRSFSMGIDSYYKISRNLIDEGQFGSALVFTPFNYARGNQYGVEMTANYAQGGFNAYANFAFQRATGEQVVSSQFLFGPDELAFIRNHWVFLDHDQRYTVSAGASYTYKDTTVYADLLYGSGLRSGFANTDELPGYYPVNVEFTHDSHLPEKYGRIRVRFDVTNVFDQSYQLRNGTGVFAPQFGPRRGFFAGLSWLF